MNKICLTVAFLLVATIVWAQDPDGRPSDSYTRLNAVYVENFVVFPTAYYDRTIVLNDHIGLLPGIGFGFVGLVIRGSVYLGGPVHMVEAGAGYWGFEGLFISANYRYMGNKGFFAKAGLQYIPEEEAFPTIALGYCF